MMMRKTYFGCAAMQCTKTKLGRSSNIDFASMEIDVDELAMLSFPLSLSLSLSLSLPLSLSPHSSLLLPFLAEVI